MIPVYWWAPREGEPGRGYWAQALLEDMFSGDSWLPTHRYQFQHFEGKPPLGIDGCVLVIPGRFETDNLFNEVQEIIDSMRWVVMFYTSDEDQRSAWWNLKHPNMIQFVQSPRVNVETANEWYPYPFGYTPHTRQNLKELGWKPHVSRKWDWSFSGQDTHSRRHLLVKYFKHRPGGWLRQTRGFAQGLPPRDYIQLLRDTRVAPCPGGPVTPDSFRLFEAMEAGCIPLADTLAGNGTGMGYWDQMFLTDNDVIPFPVIHDWQKTEGQTYDEYNPGDIMRFWRKNKRMLTEDLHESVAYLSQLPYDQIENLSVIITTSPIETHPDPTKLIEVVDSVRFHHPTAPIYITADGVRKEQARLREGYQTYLDFITWKAQHEWNNVQVITHNEFLHQAHITKTALNEVDTDVVLVLEHDTPLVTDEPIDWTNLVPLVASYKYHMIRFHFEAFIPESHRHLMRGDVKVVDGVPLQETVQWSQRPFLIGANYYREQLRRHFPETARTFVEDKMHSVAQVEPWEQHRLAIYHPEPQIKRSLHSDGRGSEQKYEMWFS